VRPLGRRSVNVAPSPGAAAHRQLAAHAAREVAADGEAEPHAVARLRERAVELDERLEDLGLPLRRDADPGVAHAHRDGVAVRLRLERHGAPGRRAADRVGEQVERDLAQLLAVGDGGEAGRARRAHEAQLLGGGLRADERVEPARKGPSGPAARS
jgi:hypothetical protein